MFEKYWMLKTVFIGYTKWNHKRNEDILHKLKIKPVIDHIQNYQMKWKESMNRMNTGRITKEILCYQPKDKNHSDIHRRDGRKI